MNTDARRVAPEPLRASATDVAARRGATEVSARGSDRITDALDDSVFERVALQPPQHKNIVDLVSLYHAIERALEHKPKKVVQLTTATASRASRDAAYSLAWTGTTLLGRRVLLIDASQPASRLAPAGTPTARSAKGERERHSLDGSGGAGAVTIWRCAGELPRGLKRLSDVRIGGACLEETIVKDGYRDLFMASFDPDALGIGGSLNGRDFGALLNNLRPHFDMIVVVPPAVLEKPLATILGGVTDGSVMVVEAGRSRRGAVKRAMEALASGTVPILGVVLSQRRGALPSWIGRLMQQ